MSSEVETSLEIAGTRVVGKNLLGMTDNAIAAVLVFFRCRQEHGSLRPTSDIERRIKKMNRSSEGSRNYLVAEYRKSGKGNRHNMKTITLKPFALCFAIFGLGQIAFAQSDLKLPDVSQAAEAKQRIALTDITVKYHRPLVNGRKIWGGLVPYGKVWRAGADENTTIEFSDAVSVEGKPLPKGVYGLHMIPNQDSWTVIFSKTNTGWGSYSYDQKEDALRVDVKPKPLAEQDEALEFEFENLKANFDGGDAEVGEVGCSFHCLCQRCGSDVAEYSSPTERRRPVCLASLGPRGAVLFNQKDQSR